MGQKAYQGKSEVNEKEMLRVFMKLEPRERLLLYLRLNKRLLFPEISRWYWQKLGFKSRVGFSRILRMQQEILAKIEKFWPKNNLLFFINNKKDSTHNSWKNNWTPEKIEKILLVPIHDISLNEPIHSGHPTGSLYNEEVELQDIMINDLPSPYHDLEENFMKEILGQVLNELPLRYREVLKLRFFENASLDDISKRFWPQLGLNRPVTREHIRQIEIQAKERAKKKFFMKNIHSVKDLTPAS